MRVTDRMVFDDAAKNTSQARDRLQSATEEVSTGQRVVHPWDDPVAAGMLVEHELSQAHYNTIVSVTSRASDELSSADTALGGLSDLVSQAREMAVQYANATYSAEQRTTASQQVRILYQQAIALLNTRVDSRYIFAGNRDDSAPFDTAGNYLGDTGIRQVEIAPGVLQNASIRADVVAKGVNGGVDVLDTLNRLESALSANDQAGIQATLDPLDTSIRQVATGRSRVGTEMSVFDSANTAARTARDAEKKSASAESDADIFDAASRLALAQRALDATLSASAQSFQLTLLNKLK